MKKLIINNLDKIHHSTIIIGGLEWKIPLAAETEDGDGYNLFLLTDSFETSTIWVSNEVDESGCVGVMWEWDAGEWVMWADVRGIKTPEEFIQMLSNTPWSLR
jgi:hypothetical protein